jgi:hypothetical protein
LDQQSGVTSLTTPAPSATATSQLAVVEEARLSCQTQLQLPDIAGVPKIFIFFVKQFSLEPDFSLDARPAASHRRF